MTTNNALADAQTGVRDTISRYAITMDGRDLDACSALFAGNAEIHVMGEQLVGAAAIRGWMDNLAKSPPGMHLTTNTVVDDLGGGRAKAISAVAFCRPNEGGGWHILTCGTYVDELTYMDGGWKFSRRVISLS